MAARVTKILFVCHGNICRSPMAEFVMKHLVAQQGCEAEFHIESAATSSEELGNEVYPPARRMLAQHGIACAGKRARRLRADDYANFDWLIGMDEENMWNMRRLYAGDPSGKIRMLLDFTGTHREVADPWYTGNFQDTWDDVLAGCTALLEFLRKNENKE